MVGYPRRRVLATGAGFVVGGALGGCLGRPERSGENESTTAQASFFVFGDLAAQVAGSVATAGTVVPVGQHGHGWEPGPRVREAILEADLFVHGVAGFQPWADAVVRDLEGDDYPVTAVAAGEGIDLLEAGSGADDHGDRGADDHDDDDGHDRAGTVDPHFWLDPLRVKTAVDNVRDGFVQVDPDNRDPYASNATAYQGQLDDLHNRFAATIADRSTDAVLVAGHDAFAYLSDRYDVEVVSLTGLGPDNQPSPQDIERAQRLIEERGLEYVCADPLESQQAAEQLVAETDARQVLPLTAMPGRTQAWQEDGWGYLAVMENVNLPTLERAMGVQ